jgi:hypothetical protein
VYAADHCVVDHGVVVSTPIERLAAFNTGLGALLAEEECHADKLRTDSERIKRL